MKFLGGIFLFLVNVILKGIVLKSLWTWFIVPLGVIDIGIFHALGFALVVSLVSPTYATDKSATEVLVLSIIHSLVTLFFGWLTHLFM